MPKMTRLPKMSRHTNFSQQVEEVTMEGNPGNNRMTGIRINKKGDLLSYIYLTTFSGAANAEVQWNDVIDHIDVLVGGSIVDTDNGVTPVEERC